MQCRTIVLYIWSWREDKIQKASGRGGWIGERTNDAKRKWHWGLGLIHMYSRLMVDFISKSHCYAMSVLLQQNEYCILTGWCVYFLLMDKWKDIYLLLSQSFMYFLGGGSKASESVFPPPFSFLKAFKSCILMNILIHSTYYKLTSITVEIDCVNSVPFSCTVGEKFRLKPFWKLSVRASRALLIYIIANIQIQSFPYHLCIKLIQECNFLISSKITKNEK